LAISESQALRLLAKRIRRLRRVHHWSQEQLGASIQRSYLADLERGFRNPSVRTLVKIANGLGAPVRELFED
jgi:transcriptional regulator with XRE-family HTH domain